MAAVPSKKGLRIKREKLEATISRRRFIRYLCLSGLREDKHDLESVLSQESVSQEGSVQPVSQLHKESSSGESGQGDQEKAQEMKVVGVDSPKVPSGPFKVFYPKDMTGCPGSPHSPKHIESALEVRHGIVAQGFDSDEVPGWLEDPCELRKSPIEVY